MSAINCYFAVSKVCNLRCRYCYVPEYNKTHQDGYDDRAVTVAERFAEKVRREGHGIGLTENEKEIFGRWLCESGMIRNLQGFMPELCIHDGNDCSFFEFDCEGNCYSCNKHFDTGGVFANWMEEPFEVILLKRKGLYASAPVSEECATCVLRPMCHSGCPMSREDGKSVDCRVKKVVYEHLPLTEATPTFNPSLETMPEDDNGRTTLRYHNPRHNKWEELRLTPEASQLIRIFLESPDLTIGNGLRQFAALHPRIPKTAVTQDVIAFLKDLYKKTVIVSLV